MQSISITALEARWKELIQEIPELKRATFEDLGPDLLSEVRRQIGGSGKVQSWQEARVGSRGGYAAVRPKAKTYYASREGGKQYAVGYITNAINSGHKQVPGRFVPTGENEGFRTKKEWVPSRHFYEDAATNAEALIHRAVESLERRMKEAVEG
jgi:hypothetical protein